MLDLDFDFAHPEILPRKDFGMGEMEKWRSLAQELLADWKITQAFALRERKCDAGDRLGGGVVA